MDESREAGRLAATLDESWDTRVKAADAWNARLDAGEIHPGFWLRCKWFFMSLRHRKSYGEYSKDMEEKWRSKDGRKEASLAWALNDTFGWSFWIGGGFKVCSVTLLSCVLDIQI